MAIFDWTLRETGYAAVAIRTTGLTSGHDKIVEIAVACADSGQPLRVVLETLVNPQRPMAGTPLHGVRDGHVERGPTFPLVTRDLVRALSGRVLVGHNLPPMMKFLKRELGKLDIDLSVPFIDTMDLRPALDDGPQVPLITSCEDYDVGFEPSVLAVDSATATGRLLRALLRKAADEGLTTFYELKAVGGERPFLDSFGLDPLGLDLTYELEESANRISRRDMPGLRPSGKLLTYYEALMVALSDMEITDAEIAELKKLQIRFKLDPREVLALHGQLFAGELVDVIDDWTVTKKQRNHLRRVRRCLEKLGWSPGG